MAAYAFKEDALWVTIVADDKDLNVAIDSVEALLSYDTGERGKAASAVVKESLKKFKRTLNDNLNAALFRISEVILKDAKKRTPKDILALEESGRMQPPGGYSNAASMKMEDIQFRVGFGAKEFEKPGFSEKEQQFRRRRGFKDVGKGVEEAAKEQRAGPQRGVTAGSRGGVLEELIAREEGESAVMRRAQERDDARMREREQHAEALKEAEQAGYPVTRRPYLYAVMQHERVDFKHDQGEHHYLLNAVEVQREKFPAILKKYLGKIK